MLRWKCCAGNAALEAMDTLAFSMTADNIFYSTSGVFKIIFTCVGGTGEPLRRWLRELPSAIVLNKSGKRSCGLLKGAFQVQSPS